MHSVLAREGWRAIKATAPDLIHSHGKLAGLAGRLAGKAWGVPTVHTFHGFHWERYGRPYIILEQALAKLTTRLIHVSDSEAQECQTYSLYGRTIFNGVAIPDRSYSQPWYPRNGREFTLVGTIARPDPIKRLTMLRAACQKAGLGYVCVSGPDARLILPHLTLYASASRKEGCPYGVLDAMAHGLAIAVTAVPGHTDLIEHNQTGWLGPVENLSQGLLHLAKDPDLRLQYGEAARLIAASRFSLDRMVKETLDTYRQCLDGSQG